MKFACQTRKGKEEVEAVVVYLDLPRPGRSLDMTPNANGINCHTKLSTSVAPVNNAGIVIYTRRFHNVFGREIKAR
jgi:hypothetical protein